MDAVNGGTDRYNATAGATSIKIIDEQAVVGRT